MLRLGIGLGLGGVSTHRARLNDEDDLPRKYLFVDGGFYERFVKDMQALVEPEIRSAPVSLEAVGSGYDRVLFYDAFPEKKHNQTEEEFSHATQLTQERFDRISTTRNFSVRPALTRGGRRQQQKGVDVLLAIECLSHAVRNNIDEATVMTSDLDFYPLFEALLQTKTKSVLKYQVGRTSPELIGAADNSEPLTARDYFLWISRDLPPEYRTSQNWETFQSLDVETIGMGTAAGRQIELLHAQYMDHELFATLVDGTRIHSPFHLRSIVEADIEKSLGSKITYED